MLAAMKNPFAYPLLLLAATTMTMTPSNAGEGPAPAAHLADSPSPYLREHADNLVAWRQWGEAAFAEARRSGKPIFLSIGYMACHWCHVMEERNFMDPDIAAFINEHFIPILVDRERRPGVDETYMLATQALTGAGGWPNNLFLTPELEPFYAGTYFPPSRFIKVLHAVENAWRTRRAEVGKEASRIAQLLRQFGSRRQTARMLTADRFREISIGLAGEFDDFHGGLEWHGPKHFRFPLLRLMARAALLDGNEKAGNALLVTLRTVIRAGVMDHLGGGFHRYAVDSQWQVPHFEKMLYTQAEAASLLLDGWLLGGGGELAAAARKTLDYVLADLAAPRGGFYSARDADSPDADGKPREGAYFVWTPEELNELLGGEDGAFALKLFGIAANSGELAGKVIVNTAAAKPRDMPRLRRVMARLLEERQKRRPPRRDEKVIAAWNGMMIAALAKAALLLDEPRYGEAAMEAARFILAHMRGEDGGLLHVHFAGHAELPATLDDHAHVILGLLALHDLTGEGQWLEHATGLGRRMHALFHDDENGGYWLTSDMSGFTRLKPTSDDDLPAAQAAALKALARLEQRTGNQEWRARAEELAAGLLAAAYKTPLSGAATLAAADELLRGETSLVRHAGGGKVRLRLRRQGRGEMILSLRIRPGWHVNAAQPLDDKLMATRVEAVGKGGEPENGALLEVSYPDPVVRRLKFSGKPLALLEGKALIKIRTRNGKNPPRAIRLTIQPCSDEICLQPEYPVFVIPPAPESSPGQ